MPQTSPTPPATRQVEKIREIIVGRQFHAVEQRLTRLEENLRPMPVTGSDTASPSAHAQQEQALEIRHLRQSIEVERNRQAEETKRLAQQIQHIARSRREAAEETQRAIQAQLGPWFQEWQGRLQQHLQQRESHLIAEFRAELDHMRQWMREELKQHPDENSEQLRIALEQFATAARAVAQHLPSTRRP